LSDPCETLSIVKHLDTRAALDHYDDLVVPDRNGEIRAVPTDDDLVVHMVVRPRRRYDIFGVRWDQLSTKLPVFLDSWQEAPAMCGRRVKVILPVALDNTDPDACPRCVREVRAWAHAPAAWWQAADERDMKRSDRDYERDQVAAWQAAERARQEAQGPSTPRLRLELKRALNPDPETGTDG
jgi:hypothetical protein